MNFELFNGDCLEVLKELPDNSVNCVVTSPPYWGLRDYGVDGQLGLEDTPDDYVAKMVEVFREVKRVLRDDGTLWLNLGDSYFMSTRGAGGKGKQHTNEGSKLIDRRSTIPQGLKPKDLVGIPWRVAFALQADGWYLRQDIIWHKPNPMPEGVKDRCTKAHEYIFLLSKGPKYYFDNELIKEPLAESSTHRYKYGFKDKRTETTKGLRKTRECQPRGDLVPIRDLEKPLGRNRRSVWTITTKPFKGAHFATFPPDLIEPCILAGCPEGGIVLDPFAGAGTTLLVAKKHNRMSIGIELNPEYIKLIEQRLTAADKSDKKAA